MFSLGSVKRAFPFRNITDAAGVSKLDSLRLVPGGGLFRRDSWTAITKSAPESVMGMGMFLPVFAYMASKEQPGERLASFAPEAIGIGTGFLVTPFVTAACCAIPGFSMLPIGVRSFVGMTVAQMAVNQPITQKLGAFIRQAGQYSNRKRGLEMGNGFRDSQNAAAGRIAAMQEMSGSFGSARRMLGNEARLLHE